MAAEPSDARQSVLRGPPRRLATHICRTHNAVMIVRPLLVTRLANTVPGLVVALLGVCGLSELLSFGRLAVIALGVTLAVRGFRMGVEIGSQHVKVRGFLWTRTVPRHTVRGLTGFPALRWQTASGRARWSPLIMFFDGLDALTFVSRHDQRCLETLMRTLGVKRA
jgi:hypothetical protein